MRIDIATLFPDMCEAVLSESIVGRGRKAGYIEINCHNIRDYTLDKHNRVDDKAYGGGTGMLMQAQPIYDCVMAIEGELPEGAKPRLIYMSPQGKTLTQGLVKELAAEENLIILCGHYEGVDQRVLDELEFEEISTGDYVVTGGELPALILCDSVARLQKGVLPNEDAYSIESHYNGILEHPQYTRP
ncbi:MAG: tRNA (guanosine(37)-N1)-methyltransferase TrmD, partial [Ruminiclostridium sp.]